MREVVTAVQKYDSLPKTEKEQSGLILLKVFFDHQFELKFDPTLHAIKVLLQKNIEYFPLFFNILSDYTSFTEHQKRGALLDDPDLQYISRLIVERAENKKPAAVALAQAWLKLTEKHQEIKKTQTAEVLRSRANQ